MSNSCNPFIIIFYIYCICMIAIMLIVAKFIDASNSVIVYGFCVYIISIMLMLVKNNSSTNDAKNNDEEASLSPSDYKVKSRRMLNSSNSSILNINIYCNSMIAMLLLIYNQGFYASNSMISYGYCIYITSVIVMLVRGTPSTNFNNDNNSNNNNNNDEEETNYKGNSRILLNSQKYLVFFYIFFNILLIILVFSGFGASNFMIFYNCCIYIVSVMLMRVGGNSSTNDVNDVEALLPPSEHTNGTEKLDHHLIDTSEIIEKKAAVKK